MEGQRVQIKARDEEGLEVEAWVEQMIAENGYAQISKHEPSSGESGISEVPGFAFTIGLEQSRQVPELICLGVAPDIASQLFAICIQGHDNAVYDLVNENQSVKGLVQGYVLRFRRVAPAILHKANLVRPHRRCDISRMVQLLLPDDNGFFPGDLECTPSVASAQDPDRLLAPTPN